MIDHDRAWEKANTAARLTAYRSYPAHETRKREQCFEREAVRLYRQYVFPMREVSRS